MLLPLAWSSFLLPLFSISVFLESLLPHRHEQLRRGRSRAGERQQFQPRGTETRGQLGKLLDMAWWRGTAAHHDFFRLNKSSENF